MNHRFFGVVKILLITLLPMSVVGCGDVAAQNTNASHPLSMTASNSINSNSAVGAAPTNALTPPSSTTKQWPDGAGVFQNIDQGTATASSGSTLAAVISSGKQGLQQALQNTPVQPSESQVAAPYIAQLENLQATYIGSLYALFSSAKAEYHAGHQSKLQIEAKYLPQAVILENKAQDQVNSVLFTLRAQLAAKGLPTDEVNVLRNAYYSQVAQMQAQFGR